jgi:VWFA-related protein
MNAALRGVVFCAAGMLAAGLPEAGLDAARRAAPAAAQQTRFVARTQGVLVATEVRRGGSPASGLTAADFEVRDNGVLQTIEVLDSTDAPINAVLALDASASTAGQRLVDLTAGSRALLDELKAGDHVALTTFNQRVSPSVPLTTDLNAVRAALGRLAPIGQTALLDGVYTALLGTHEAVGSSLVVVYTDGADTASWLQPDEVLEAAKRSDAVVDAVVVRSSHRLTDLKDVVDATGGQVVVIDATAGLAAEFARIVREFRSRYLLTFVPAGVTPGGFHKLDVRAKGRNLTVHARAGYFSDIKAP